MITFPAPVHAKLITQHCHYVPSYLSTIKHNRPRSPTNAVQSHTMTELRVIEYILVLIKANKIKCKLLMQAKNRTNIVRK